MLSENITGMLFVSSRIREYSTLGNQELDKLISFSGTPTVVWRRTGEICLVAPEFCMLTEWSMEELVGRKKYIYEVWRSRTIGRTLIAYNFLIQLFENQSVVEYWESFASHAFENTTQSVYSHCVLLKPSGAPVPATFCFSIRRDLFDLPSMVIGMYCLIRYSCFLTRLKGNGSLSYSARIYFSYVYSL